MNAEERKQKAKEYQQRWIEAHPVRARYMSMISSRKRRGLDVSSAPTPDQVVAKLGELMPEDEGIYTWSISFTDGDEMSCYSKGEETLDIEKCHWAKVLKRGTLKSLKTDLSKKQLQRRVRSSGKTDVKRINNSKIDVKPYIGKTFGRCICVDVKVEAKDNKCYMKCSFCGHKFKHRLRTIMETGKCFCRKCQSQANRAHAASKNSSIYFRMRAWNGEARTNLNQIYCRTVSDYTFNSSRPEFIESVADIGLLVDAGKLDMTRKLGQLNFFESFLLTKKT